MKTTLLHHALALIAACLAVGARAMSPPLETVEGCYTRSSVFTYGGSQELDRFHDDSNVQSPEACHYKCLENDACTQWNFRADTGGNSGGAQALCILLSGFGGTRDKSSAFTRGPRVCTEAPTMYPTVAPTMYPVTIIQGCYQTETTYTFGLSFLIAKFEADPEVNTPELCNSKCLEYEECNYWNFRADDASATNTDRCELLRDYGRAQEKNARFTSGPRECTNSPTDSPTDSPTMFPVKVFSGCYTSSSEYTASGSQKFMSYHDNPNVQSPEQCNSKCLEYDNCNYWNFRADTGGNSGGAQALCILLSGYGNIREKSSAFTRGPRMCTAAPTESPTMFPTLSPVEVTDGCYTSSSVYTAGGSQKIESFHDVRNVQSPEQCQSKCLENDNCEYWNFRADTGGNSGGAQALCTLLSGYGSTRDKSSAFTRGPRVCS